VSCCRPTEVGQRGAAGVLLLACLPWMILALALTVDAGAVLLARARLQSVVDLGALAGVQDVDLDALAQGEVRLMPAAARDDAASWVDANLRAAGLDGQGGEEGADVQVRVVNPDDGPACWDRVTSRRLLEPTVCVWARLPLSLALMPAGDHVGVEAHADAAVRAAPPVDEGGP